MNREARKVRKRRLAATIARSQKHDNGVVRIGCTAIGMSALLSPLTDEIIARVDRRQSETGRLWIGFPGRVYEWSRRVHFETKFKAYHELTDEEFADPHWQTLFRIEYPQRPHG